MTSKERWAGALRDALPPAAAVGLLPVVAATAPSIERPLERMRAFVEVERSLGLFVEPRVHRWFLDRPALMRVMKLTYVAAHMPGVIGVLSWARQADR